MANAVKEFSQTQINYIYNMALSVQPPLTLVQRFEAPVARTCPGSHGPRAEVGVLSGLVGQLQTHGGYVPLSNGNHIPVDSQPHHRMTLKYVASSIPPCIPLLACL